MDFVWKQLYAITYTKTRLEHRLGVLQHVLKQVVYTEAEETESVNVYHQELRAYATGKDLSALEALGTDWIPSLNEQSLTSLRQQVAELVSTAPLLTLYVPAELDEAVEAELGTWCRTELDERLLLELVIDPNVLGGCGFIHNDSYYEYSLRTALAEKPQLLRDIINTYAS